MPSQKSGGSPKAFSPAPSNTHPRRRQQLLNAPSPIMATTHSNDSLHNEELGDKGNALHAEVLVDQELMSDAFMAENREHEMGLWVS